MRYTIDPLAPAPRSPMNLREDIVPRDVSRYLSDVLNHQFTVVDLITGLDERLSTLIDIAAVKVQLQQNQNVRTISTYAVILTVSTALAGIHGMNLDRMSELRWEYSYFFVPVIMFVIVASLMWVLRRNKWLQALLLVSIILRWRMQQPTRGSRRALTTQAGRRRARHYGGYTGRRSDEQQSPSW